MAGLDEIAPKNHEQFDLFNIRNYYPREPVGLGERFFFETESQDSLQPDPRSLPLRGFFVFLMVRNHARPIDPNL